MYFFKNSKKKKSRELFFTKWKEKKVSQGKTLK